MAMLAAAAIAADIMPQRNGCRRAGNKQRYGCTSTENLRIVWLLFLVTVRLSLS